MATPQDLFLADTKTKIQQYLYTELEQCFDPTIEFLQLISKIGPINWHKSENQQRLQRVFTALSAAVGTYTMLSGDFRTFMLAKSVDILYEEFKNELFSQYVMSSYNVLPETVVGSIDNAPMIAPPQTTNFPGLPNTSGQMNPIPKKLVPKTLYEDL